jgi:serine/threonine-protein kinase
VSRPAFLATAAVALVALGAAAWGWLRPGPAPQISRFEVELPGYSVAVASAFRVALSPDGRQIVYAADVASGRQLMRRRLEELTPQPIPGTEGGYNPAFSPAGDKIAFVAGSPRALKVVSLAGGPPAVLTDSLVDSGGVTWSPDGYIYYDAALEGDGIARIRATGGTPEIASRPANDTESWHTAPAALPNGKGVLFHMARGRGALPFDVAILDTRTGIHRVLFRGVAPRYVPTGHLLYTTETGVLMAIRFDPDRLAISGEATPVADGLLVRSLGRVETSIAGNGTLIYVAGTSITRMRELVWISRDGSMTPADTTWRAPITTTPWISPDGSRAVMAVTVGARPEVWVKQLDRGPATRLAEAGLSPGWTPGGREVVFYGNGGAAEVPADGSVAPTIRFTYRDAWDGLRYSPDGQWLIGTSAGDIFGRRTAGDSAMVPLVSGPGIQRRAVISPDGRWLAYDSDEGGVTQVYVRPFPATQTGKYQISTNGGAMPHWSRDGRELFYAIPRITRSEILAVPVSLTPVFSAGAHRTLFRTDALGIPFVGFDVHPDGKRFLFARPLDVGTSAADRLVVVENFFEVLKEKLP